MEIADVEPYERSQFYRRELPCILAVLQSLPHLPLVAIIDGYVWLGEQRRGLGAHLHEALDKRSGMFGVAKTRYAGAEPVALVTRGGSRMPLYITPRDGRCRGRKPYPGDARRLAPEYRAGWSL